MYKDKDKQREATREATQRYRAKNKDSVLSGQKQVSQNARGLPVIPEVGDTLSVIPDVIPDKITQAEIDALPEDVKAAIAREPANEYQVRTERAVRYNRLFSEQTVKAAIDNAAENLTGSIAMANRQP